MKKLIVVVLFAFVVGLFGWTTSATASSFIGIDKAEVGTKGKKKKKIKKKKGKGKKSKEGMKKKKKKTS